MRQTPRIPWTAPILPALAAVVLIGLAGRAVGFEITGNQNAGGGAVINGAGGQTIARISGDGVPDGTPDPFKYDWDDPNGSADLLLGTNKIYSGSGLSFALDLARGGVSGNITGTGTQALQTTSATLSTNTYPTIPENSIAYSGSVTIRNPGDISMGGISTRISDGAGHQYRGSITIGQDGTVGPRAGNVRVNFLNTSGSLWFGGSRGATGGVTICSSGDVRIQDKDDDATAVLGDILGYSPQGGAAATINIQHQGGFRVRNIDNSILTNWPSAGSFRASFTSIGNVIGAPNGAFFANNIYTFFGVIGYNNRPTEGNVTIGGYTNVTIAGDILTYCNQANKAGGSVAIANIAGDIAIGGTINLNSVGNNAYDGTLDLAAAGNVTVSNLNLSAVKYAAFDSGGTSYIAGTLLGTNGAAATNNNISNLRAPAGKYIYYNPGKNPGLLGLTYRLTNLTATAAGGQLTAGANTAPVVDAGTDRNITLPATAGLNGLVTDDGLPSGILYTQWSKISGPGTVTFGDSNLVNTTAFFSTNGTYVLQLWAYDTLLSASDTVSIVVNPAGANMAPVVDAGPDQNITLPATASLDGTVTDDGLPDGITNSQWSKVSGPGSVTFGNSNLVATTASFSTNGAYVLQLRASDGALSASDTVSIVVNSAGFNTAPLVKAGPDQSISLPALAGLDGTVTDDGLPGGVTNILWSKVSGPGTVTFGNSNQVDTTVSFSTNGAYVLQLWASDTALSASDTVAIAVSPQTKASILFDPVDATVNQGQTALFRVMATGGTLLKYQWRRNSTNITAATNSYYVTPAATLSDSGALYRVVVSNIFGPAVTSGVAVLNVRAGGPADALTVFETSGSAQSARPVSISRIFAQGEIANFAAAFIDSTQLLTQCDVKNRWPDNSLKHAIVSFVIPQLASNGSVLVSFGNQTNGNNTGYLDQSDMTDAAYDFEAAIRLSGATTNNISARDMLEAGKWRYWLQGPIMTAVIIEDRSTNRAYDVDIGDGSKALHPIFEAWFYPDNKTVDCGATIENCWASSLSNNSLRDLSYDLELTSGNSTPTTKYTQTSVLHQGKTRWQKRFWVATAPATIRIDHNLDYLISTKAIPSYDTSVHISEPLINQYTNWPINTCRIGGDNATGIGSYRYNLSASVPQPWRGLDSTWDILYLYTFDDRLLPVMLDNADLAGGIPYFLREADTLAGSGHYFDKAGTTGTFGLPVSIYARKTVSLGDLDKASSAPADRIRHGPLSYANWTSNDLNRAQMPDLAYLPYLLTGRYYYMEQLALEAAYAIGWTKEQWGMGLLQDAEMRGAANAMRTVAYAAFIVPDGVMRDYFEDSLLNTIAWETGRRDFPLTFPGHQQAHGSAVSNKVWATGASPLSLWSAGSTGLVSAPVKTDGSVRRAESTAEVHMLAEALGMSRGFGFPGAELLLRQMAQYDANLLLNPVVSPYLIEADRQAAIAADSDWIRAWDELNSFYDALPTAWRTGQDVDGGNGFEALAAMSFLYPYEDELGGYRASAAYDYLKANKPEQDKFGTVSPKCARVPPATARYAHPVLAAIPPNMAFDLGAYPSYYPPGGNNENGITDYSGFTYDTTHRCMLMFGGGHSTTFANYVMRLELTTGSALQWKADYPRTPREAMVTTNLAPQGYWKDSGLPLTTHTYDHLVWHPPTGRFLMLRPTTQMLGDNLTTNILNISIVTDPRLWHYDPELRVWTMGPNASAQAGQVWPSNGASEYDPVSGNVIAMDPYGIWTYVPETQQATKIKRYADGNVGIANNLVYFPPNDRFYMISQGNPTRVFEVTLDRTIWTNSNYVEVLGITNAPVSQESGFAYDPNRKVIGGGVRNGHFYTYDPLTKAWSDYIMDSSSGAIGTQAFHALAYDYVNSVFIFITDGPSERHTWAYRLGRNGTTAFVDTDSDGLSDYWEIQHGLNPNKSDSDNDGLPDGWEVAHGLSPLLPSGVDGALGDPDGDGMDNLSEYIADTNPRDAQSRLEISGISLLPEGLRLNWKGGQLAKQYIQTRQNLNSTSEVWTSIFTNATLPTPLTNFVVDAGATNSALFYRIKAAR